MLKIKYLIVVFLLAQFSLATSLTAEYLSKENSNLIEKAKSGDAEAQFKIASAYDSGSGAPRDGSKAMKWYLMAANSGMAEAQNSVGSVFQAEKKYKKAFKWYAKAAEQNHIVAINNLAYLYDLGLGVKQDRKKGFELYLKSANLGWPQAMWNLANAFGAGNLGEKDFYSACVWSLRAKKYAEPADEKLKVALGRTIPYLERTLNSDEFKKCASEAEAWSPQ
jgi:TPR repeat protein